MQEIAEKVDKLEAYMMQLAYEHTKTEMELRSLSKEMKGFKSEMRDFKDEMRVFKDEMGDFKDEMRVFKDEMGDFKDEMKEFKNEMRASKKENDRRWGDVVNKMGTLVEDIVAPSLPRIVREDFGCAEIDDFMINRRIRYKKQGATAELDALLLCQDKLFINETKSTPKIEYVNKFLEKINEIPEMLPEYRNKEIIPVFSSLSIPEDILNYLTKNRIYALAMGEDVMQVLNLKAVQAESRNR